MNQPRPVLSVAEAVAAFDVTKRTLQRRLVAGDIVGASKDTNGHWKIPIEALHAASFTARQGTTDDATPAPNSATSGTPHTTNPIKSTQNSATSDATEAASLRAILRDTQQQLEAERYRREAAEQNANDLRTALRMLEAGTSQRQPAQPQTPRRRWWQRGALNE